LGSRPSSPGASGHWPRTYKITCLILPPSNICPHPCVRTVHLSDPTWPTHHGPLIASTDATTATATEGAAGPVPAPRPARQNSLAETLQTLEKRLAQRPDRQELEDRNILRGAPVQRTLVLMRLTAIVAGRWEYCSGAAGHERSIAKVPT
jgi:hypothetical protein